MDYASWPLTFIRRKRVLARTDLPPSSLHRLVAEGKFPRSVRISANRVAWVEAEVEAWIRDKIEASDRAGRLSEKPSPRTQSKPRVEQSHDRSAATGNAAQKSPVAGRVVPIRGTAK